MRKNLTGVILDVDELVLSVLGFARDDMVGHRSTDFLHPEDHEQAFSSWVRMLAEPGVPQTIQVRHRNASGQWLWLETANVQPDPDAESVDTGLTLIDRPPDDRTSVSSHLLRRLAEALPMGVAQIDGARRIVFSNGKLDEVTGHSSGEFLHDRLDQLRAVDRAVLDQAVESVLAGDDTEIELSLTHPERGLRQCNVVLSALAGRSGYGTTGALLCITDVTEDVQRRAEIMHRAAHDSLTGCLNRAAVTDALAEAVTGCTGEPGAAGVAVLFLDLDRFKEINDAHGHTAGDNLLAAVADRLRHHSRNAVVGRLGGDEFLVVAFDVSSAEQADRLGRRLAQSVRRPLDIGGVTIRPGVSVGVSWSADPSADPGTLVTRADKAMYENKRRRVPLRAN
jgi:diguanylate cyclase (GGDEF)-like protein/PAS domain S-box-containing protein